MIFSTVSVLAIMASLLVSTVAIANSMMFEQSVYAVDNCDATSTCYNDPGTGTGNTQINDCANFSDCANLIFDDSGRNTQTNDCTSFSYLS